VEDRAHAGDRVVGLQVPVVVPGQGGDPLALLHTQPPEHVGELGGPLRHVPVAVAVNALLALGDDLLLAE